MGSKEIKELLKNAVYCKLARQYVRKDLCKCYVEGEQCQCQLGKLEGKKKTFLLNKEYLEKVIVAQGKYTPKDEREALINQGIITAYKLLVQVIDEGVLICKEEE
ncbi:hypothetical protein PP657_gp054 [Bacillus phage BCPST]|uniref:Uncharacterized protein n=1 Tax=Bacillus phage BCPST TaxID=2801506 RepID=A0AAE7P3J6_9CAUD|nr:hypothetical protein PP657_gp054 [Bacillus phage BCPST]QQO38672.1 hypothetical protein BCPST_054 [Bacillus phage BCPST]QSJ04263.1 hypothetical protein BCP6_058 [Bacillus phage BCP6]